MPLANRLMQSILAKAFRGEPVPAESELAAAKAGTTSRRRRARAAERASA